MNQREVMRWLLMLLFVTVVATACGGSASDSSSESYDTADGVEQVAPMVVTSEAGEMEVISEAVMAEEASDEAADMEMAVDEAAMDDGAATEGDAAGGAMSAPEAAPAGDVEAQSDTFNRLIIYTAGMQIRVEEPRTTARTLTSLARRYGGFVSGSDVYEVGEDERTQFRADVQLRIPAENYDQVMSELRDLGEVLVENSTTDDVTAEFVDLQARVDNLQRTETEVQALLTEARSRGDKMEDILVIYNELTDLRAQIESMQGQLNVLGDLVALSTINIELIPPILDPLPTPTPTVTPTPTATPTPTPEPQWRPDETAGEARSTLIDGLKGLADFLIYFSIAVLPYLLLLALVGYVVYRLLRGVVVRRDVAPAATVRSRTESEAMTPIGGNRPADWPRTDPPADSDNTTDG